MSVDRGEKVYKSKRGLRGKYNAPVPSKQGRGSLGENDAPGLCVDRERMMHLSLQQGTQEARGQIDIC